VGAGRGGKRGVSCGGTLQDCPSTAENDSPHQAANRILQHSPSCTTRRSPLTQHPSTHPRHASASCMSSFMCWSGGVGCKRLLPPLPACATGCPGAAQLSSRFLQAACLDKGGRGRATGQHKIMYQLQKRVQTHTQVGRCVGVMHVSSSVWQDPPGC
jgi:hypothetical protein